MKFKAGQLVRGAAAAALAAVLATQVAAPAAAHPHIFITARAELVFQFGRITALRHIWQFDEAWSAFAVQGLDANNDRVLTRDELGALATTMVTTQGEYDYFTRFTIGGTAPAFAAPSDYFLDVYGGRLTLFFTLPLAEPAAVDGQVVLDVFDPAYYVGYEFDPAQPMVLVGAPAGCLYAYIAPAEVDAEIAAALAAIPVDGVVPPELAVVTEQLANRITVNC